MAKFLARCAAGIFGGTIVGILSFTQMINYGGNYGCFKFADKLFGTQGYESCGSLGAIGGVLIGLLVGFILISTLKITNYKKAAIWLFVGAFVLPLIYGAIMLWPPFGDDDMLLAVVFILMFMILSGIPSLIITILMQLREIAKQKKHADNL